MSPASSPAAPQAWPAMHSGAASGLYRDLARHARRLGFAALGVTEATPMPELRLLLEERRREGRYPAFCQQEPALRADPQRWLEGARSIWVAALPYEPPPAPGNGAATPGAQAFRPAPPRPYARLAAYAASPDYHRIVERRLRALVRWAARRTGRDPERDFRIFVDTGPPVERELLRRSGAGFIGKNTCAYVPGAGSWVVLGCVVTTLPAPPPAAPSGGRAAERPPAAPADAFAGCTRCLEACPTGALKPYELDPTRCISHWTQERGPLEHKRRTGLAGWVFGCDVCQVVCPYNTPQQAPLAHSGPGRLRPGPGAGVGWRVSLLELVEMDGAAFEARFGPTAAAWRGKNVLQRNAAYLLGRVLARPGALHDPAARRALETLGRLAHQHPSPAVREACGWAARCAAGQAAPEGRA